MLYVSGSFDHSFSNNHFSFHHVFKSLPNSPNIPVLFLHSWEHPQQYFWKSFRRFRALEILRGKSN